MVEVGACVPVEVGGPLVGALGVDFAVLAYTSRGGWGDGGGDSGGYHFPSLASHQSSACGL